MIGRAIAAALLLALASCVRPSMTVCGQPGSCVITVCPTGDCIAVKPVGLKDLLQ